MNLVKVLKKNNEEAVKWYKKAADQGDAWGQWRMGQIYEYGDLLPQNYVEAVKWYRLVAETGDANAMVTMGRMYEEGKGFDKDFSNAYFWYKLADNYADEEDEDLKEELIENENRVAKNLTEQQLDTVKKNDISLETKVNYIIRLPVLYSIQSRIMFCEHPVRKNTGKMPGILLVTSVVKLSE